MVAQEANQPGRARHAGLAFFLLLAGVAQASDGGATLYEDRAVAVIDGHVLTWSELEFETRVLLIRAGGVEAATRPLDLDILKKGLETVIGQRLVSAEADKLRAFSLEDGEVETALQGFERQFADRGAYQAFLLRHEMDEASLGAVLMRSLRTQRVFDGKLRLRAQVSEAEAKRLQLSRADLKDLPLPLLRQKVFNERYTELIANELKTLRKQARVRLLGAFAPELNPDAGAH
jgi:hypothetical protein